MGQNSSRVRRADWFASREADPRRRLADDVDRVMIGSGGGGSFPDLEEVSEISPIEFGQMLESVVMMERGGECQEFRTRVRNIGDASRGPKWETASDPPRSSRSVVSVGCPKSSRTRGEFRADD